MLSSIAVWVLATFIAFMTYPKVEPIIDHAFGIQRHKQVIRCDRPKPEPQTFEALSKRTE